MPPADPSMSPSVSATTRATLQRVQRMVPPMLERFHKGQLGRVGVIGGSEDYTGAPFFSAMASARLGCDMSHVICTPAAAAVIKTYSPNLMVHPLMRQSAAADTDLQRRAAEVGAPVVALLGRLHVLVVGPGLGRDALMQATAAHVVAAARARGLPVVLDADGLQLVQQDPGLVRGYGQAVLTPNVVEYGRLARMLARGGGAMSGPASEEKKSEPGDSERSEEKKMTADELARMLGGVTIVQKGAVDVVTDGTTTLRSDVAGGRKRSGGQGDTLTGAIATLLAWRTAYLDGLWAEPGEKLGAQELMVLAAYGGSAITRECSRLAFAKRGRSLQASDLTDEVHTAFLHLLGEPDVEEAKL